MNLTLKCEGVGFQKTVLIEKIKKTISYLKSHKS